MGLWEGLVGLYIADRITTVIIFILLFLFMFALLIVALLVGG